MILGVYKPSGLLFVVSLLVFGAGLTVMGVQLAL